MKNEEVKSKQLIELVKAFQIAINDGDEKVINKIVGDKLLFECNMAIAGKSYAKKFNSKNDLLTLKANLPASLREIDPITSINQNRAKVVFERFGYCLFPKSKFSHAFLRQSYFFEKNNSDWKLILLKDEVLSLSRYNIKKSLMNLAEQPAKFLVNYIYKINER